MRTLVIGMAVVLGSFSTAQAGTYISAGFGTNASLSGEMDMHFDPDNMSLGRVGVGWRTSGFAVEGVMFGTALQGVSTYVQDGQMPTAADFSTLSLGVDLKYHVRVAGPLEVYGRVGVNRTWLKSGETTESSLNFAGQGYLIGAGIQYSFKVLPMLQTGLWMDYNRHVLSLTDPMGPTMEGQADNVMIGLTVGSL